MPKWIWLTIASLLAGIGTALLWLGHPLSGTVALGSATLLLIDLAVDSAPAAWFGRRGAK